MNINIIYEWGGEEWSYKSVFSEFSKQCELNNPDITFNHINGSELRKQLNNKYLGNSGIYGPFYLIVENPYNNKYILVSYWDKLINVTQHYDVTGFNIDNCVEIITSAGVHLNDITYDPTDYNYTPFSYIVCQTHIESIIDTLYNNRNNRVFPPKPMFRGLLYNFRHLLQNDNRFNIIDKTKNYLDINQYIEELSEYQLNLSLNGAGEICHRDIEILGLGSALLRPELNVKFYNELIPNYHYISVPYNDLDIKTLGYNKYFKELSDRIIDRFEQVKNDKEYIDFVSNNGRKWYEENGTIKANADILNKLINFNKLL